MVVKKVTVTPQETGVVGQCELRMRPTDKKFNLRSILKALHDTKVAHNNRIRNVLEGEAVQRFMAFEKTRYDMTDDELLSFTDGVPWGDWRLGLFILTLIDPAVADNNVSFMACAALGAEVPPALCTQTREDLFEMMGVMGMSTVGLRRVEGRFYMPGPFNEEANGIIVVSGDPMEFTGHGQLAVLYVIETGVDLPSVSSVIEFWTENRGGERNRDKMLVVEFDDRVAREVMLETLRVVKSTLAGESLHEADAPVYTTAVEKVAGSFDKVKRAVRGAHPGVAWFWMK